MSLTELQQAFQTIRSQLAQPLDIVSYDACNMATIEVAEVTSILAPAMSASVEKEPSHGADYNYLLTHLATETKMGEIMSSERAFSVEMANANGTFSAKIVANISLIFTSGTVVKRLRVSSKVKLNFFLTMVRVVNLL